MAQPNPDDPFTGLAKPARRALAAIGVATLADVAARNAADLAALHGMGRRGVALLRERLIVQGLKFADE
jgi:hypothetical protein